MTKSLILPASALAFALALPAPVSSQSGWSTPVLVPNIGSTISDTSPTLSADGLTMYFASSRGGDWEIYETTRTAAGQPWSTPNVVAAASDPATESDPYVTADSLELYFYSTRSGGQGGSDVMRTTRASTASAWGPASFVTELNSTAGDGSPSLTEDGLTIFVLSARVGSPNPPNAAIWVATRPNRQSPFGTPVLVNELATNDANRGPEISYDGLELYWMQYDSATRASNLMRARRTSTRRPFDTPEIITELSSTNRIDGPAVDAQRNVMFLPAFNSQSGARGFQIHETTFQGLTGAGTITASSSMAVHYRDTGSFGLGYIGFFSLGNGPTPIPINRTVPLNLDPIFQITGGGIPTVTTGFLGVLDPAGEALATITDPGGVLAGVRLWTGFFTVAPGFPVAVKTISNSCRVEFQ